MYRGAMRRQLTNDGDGRNDVDVTNLLHGV